MSGFTLSEKLAEDCFAIGSMPLCDVMLLNDMRYPWCVLVPRVPGLTELMQLDTAQAQQLFVEMKLVSATLSQESGITKLNVGALGNLVPQLHIHVLGRSKQDAAWPGPVWGFGQAQPYELEQARTKVEQWRLLWRDHLKTTP